MSEPIESALTAEEWEEMLSMPAGERWRYRELNESGLSSHGIAAAALYGQSFGFTREDVRELREDVLANAVFDGGSPQFIAWLESLIARISALLPPE